MTSNKQLQGLSDYLKEEYEKQITQLQRTTNRKKAEILEQGEQAGKQEADKIHAQAQKRAKHHKNTAIASAHTKVRQQIQLAKKKSADEVFEQATQQLLSMPKKELQKLVEEMLKQAKKSGATGDTSVWKQAKIKDAKSDLNDVAIRIESEKMLYEDSLSMRLEEMRDEASKLVEDALTK